MYIFMLEKVKYSKKEIYNGQCRPYTISQNEIYNERTE